MRYPTGTVVVALTLLLLSQTVVASGSFSRLDGSEPDFLEDIGPQEERSDNPVAAAFVAVIVLAVIVRGLLVDRSSDDAGVGGEEGEADE